MNVIKRLFSPTVYKLEVDNQIPADATSEEIFEYHSSTKWSINMHEEYVGAFVLFCLKSSNPQTAGTAKLLQHLLKQKGKKKLKLSEKEMAAMIELKIDGVASLLTAHNPAELSSIRADLFNLLTISTIDEFIKSQDFAKANTRVAQLQFLHENGFV